MNIITDVQDTYFEYLKKFYFLLDVCGLCCCMGFSLVGVSWGLLSLYWRYVGFSSWWLLLLQSAASGFQKASVIAACGLSSPGAQDLEHRFNSCSTVLVAQWYMGYSQTRYPTSALVGKFFFNSLIINITQVP